ncbi:BNR repeat-containing protein [Lutibacter sp. A64]|uniref:BNR repeat-containing protein n=1 Tax=Lutibacter sp. A64 TaxID=2918526 RepID=UPI001F06AE73|nr:BNR repeat-containing protein [Lutibacter sp. A64]UMB54147.1 BNR repeat-containing protein [Lutibacter sp. A64]
MKLTLHTIIFTTLLGVFIMFNTLAQVKVINESISNVDESALNFDGKYSSAINGRTFQKDALISHKGYQYVVYYNSERRVCISRRSLPNGEWKTIRFMDYHFKSSDSHNAISMGICPNDGTIHVAFDHHVDTLHYRVSIKGLANNPKTMKWDASSFGPILPELEKGKPFKLTYPKFWQTPEGNLQFNYRVRGSGNGDRMLVDYNAAIGKWENTRQIDSAEGIFKDALGVSDSRCSYPNGYDYDNEGTLHATWVWRENSQGANHDLVYVYSKDKGNTWKNNVGKSLKEIPQVNSEGIVVAPIRRELGLMNDHGQAIDSKNRIHVVMYHSTEKTIKDSGSVLGASRWGPGEARRYHHYWRDVNGQWQHFEMDLKVGNRPKVFVDNQDNLIMIYAGSNNLVIENNDQDNRDLIIAVATAKNNWKDWHIQHTVKGPYMNDMLGDFYRWKEESVLSVILQDVPNGNKESSTLKVVDLIFK